MGAATQSRSQSQAKGGIKLVDPPLFQPLARTTLLGRLAREMAEACRELIAGPGQYLSAAFLPNRIRDWFPVRLASLIGGVVVHPISFLAAAASTDDIGKRRRRLFIPVLSASAVIHGVLIVYLIYLALISPFAGLRVVNRAYRLGDVSGILAKLYYPPQVIRQHQLDNLKKLEELQRQETQRREEAARRQKEKEEREKAEKEKKAKEEADQKSKEDSVKAEEAKSKSSASQFGEINEAPIKDMIGAIYDLYKAGGLGLTDLNFSMMATFKIERDGSLSHIDVPKSSGSKVVDEKGIRLLQMIGESRALGPLADLSSGSIRLDLSENTARLTITAFAPTADAAKAKADLLNFFFWGLRIKEKNRSPDVAELLSLMKVRADNKRLDADLTVPRARANEMFKNKFNGSQP